MALSRIESFVFGGPCAHFVTALNFTDGLIVVQFKPIEDNRQDGEPFVVAKFADADQHA
jgi:hypothetical protein